MTGKTDKKKDTGTILLGFATLMFGMDTMSGAVAGLADVPAFRNMFIMFKNPLFGILFCVCLITANVLETKQISFGFVNVTAGLIVFPLRHFFSDSYVNDGGEEMSTREIKMALKDIIDNEDKSNPLSDEALCRLLAEKGYPIARRTVSKYREMMGIPVKRFRKN